MVPDGMCIMSYACLTGIYFRLFHGVLPMEKTEIDTAALRQ